MNNDETLFRDRNGNSISVSEILRDVYNSSTETKDEISMLVTQLSQTQYSAAEALALLPHINELITAKIKNNDILIKLTNAITRGYPKNNDVKDTFLIPEEERLQLLEAAKEYRDNTREKG